MNNDVVFTYNSCILFYCRERETGTEKKRERQRERERDRERDREHAKDGSWIADYVYEGIKETLGV